MKRKALFLDRDGVINVDNNYVHTVEQFEFVEGIFELCKVATLKNYSLVVVTNQSGIGRGMYSESTFQKLTIWMCDIFVQNQCPISKVYYCPYHPTSAIGKYRRSSDLRKPGPGMLKKAQAQLNLSMQKSILIGDQVSDIEAGKASGVGINLLFTSNKSRIQESTGKCFILNNLQEAQSFLK